MQYQTPPLGSHLLSVMYGIDKNLLNDHDAIEKIVYDALSEEQFKTFGDLKKVFTPIGYTLLIGLEESHFGLHTYPEYNMLNFVLNSCRGPDDGSKVYQHIKNCVHPSNDITIHFPLPIDIDYAENLIEISDILKKRAHPQ